MERLGTTDMGFSLRQTARVRVDSARARMCVCVCVCVCACVRDVSVTDVCACVCLCVRVCTRAHVNSTALEQVLLSMCANMCHVQLTA